MKYFALSLFAASLCSAQSSSLAFYCEAPPTWTNIIKYPTTTNRMQFVGPLDGTYGNACEVELWNAISVRIDQFDYSIELRVEPKWPGGFSCPRIYAPVSGLGIEFGPLPVGYWKFWSSAYRFTNWFIVFPEPAREQIRLSRDAAALHLKWPAVGYLKYELQASTVLSNWQTTTTNYTFTGGTMTATVALDTPYRFFRLRRSPLTNDLGFLGQGGCP